MQYTTQEQRAITRALNIVRGKLAETKGDFYTCCDDSKRLCELRLAGQRDEKFMCIFLTSQHERIADEILFTGTINAASVYPRTIIRRALELNAAALIISHNHPSGKPEPSQSDIRLTNEIKKACDTMDIALLDHIIVGKTIASFAQRGLLY